MTVCLTKSTRVYTDSGITGPWAESISRMVAYLRREGWTVATDRGTARAKAPTGEYVELEAATTPVEESAVIGVSRGWAHASYVDAYGYSGPADEDYAAGWRAASEHRTPGTPTHDAYRRAFTLGAERYRAGRWQDGSPRD